MFIVGLISWWYRAGWLGTVSKVRLNLANSYDYFSLDILVRTLFAPFRQISAGKVRGSLDVQLRAVMDNLISRIIGAIMRSLVLMVGVVVLTLLSFIGLLRILVWPIVPMLPVLFIVFFSTGWIPWQM